MVYGLPSWGDTPVDPHSAFTHIKHYPIDGGLVDGPVYTSIYKNLIGITLNDPDEYADFQSDLAVYHDDYGDCSTNEPTMDGTASLIYLLAAQQAEGQEAPVAHLQYEQGAIVRGNVAENKIALVFSGDEFGDGADFIRQILQDEKLKASFFLTGRYYKNPAFKKHLQQLHADGHYMGAHSDQHLLYADWSNRNKLLVSRTEFEKDLRANYVAMEKLGIPSKEFQYFLPPYEWYNDSIAAWTRALGFQLINYTPGTLSHADYTVPGTKAYRGSEEIMQSILRYESEKPGGLNGFMLLMHIGTDPARSDKFYRHLPALIRELRRKGYGFVRIDELLGASAG
jgi:peptidoglycan/xylan/chitin deacetylase (PgdA/CDA1 family)